jgi:trigger factor
LTSFFWTGAASLDELKAKIKEDAESQFAQSNRPKLLADVTEFLISSTKLTCLQIS